MIFSIWSLLSHELQRCKISNLLKASILFYRYIKISSNFLLINIILLHAYNLPSLCECSNLQIKSILEPAELSDQTYDRQSANFPSQMRNVRLDFLS